jgi:hypothetical protein
MELFCVVKKIDGEAPPVELFTDAAKALDCFNSKDDKSEYTITQTSVEIVL